ncbi:tRNA(NNU) t(6)A37 threonylcarbamoyladenosine modification; threonine-dependent ADP-forming ATPase [Candidatus Hydrogenisulfobacillus filiaventi]|uniref:Threonylcarbamoyl-AMP synthase n=1 Tax=Candidatus Hydrogenisulfobacillus filiaventi TaxID=2707344 RepID=A0A6F8ZF95_9FIRM|nr:tRNA(NNU) t(6)A37 threonylcarbamoyladenosine modification; threonine-dependent ADP-forming ATPase [Candidatus Hydrogenisulfobacillus filiaventi]
MGVTHTRVVPAATGLAEAAALLAAGEVVAFPTETVYGLGADATNAAAAARIFAAKGRPADNPLIVHIAEPADLGTVAAPPVPDLARTLAERFWPGPLTLVLPAAGRIPPVVRGGLATVAVRCPAHPVARDLIRALGRPVAAPSANRSGRPSPTTAAAVLEDLDGRIPLILDGGPTGIGVESTVIDLTTRPVTLLRPGGLPVEALEPWTGPLARPRAGEPARSPGLKYRHYAPRAPLFWLARPDAAWPEAVRRQLEARGIDPGRTVVLSALPGGAAAFLVVEPLGPDPAGAARRLFEGLRAADRAGAAAVVAVLPETGLAAGVGPAVADRLRRAAEAVW